MNINTYLASKYWKFNQFQIMPPSVLYSEADLYYLNYYGRHYFHLIQYIDLTFDP